MDVVEYAVRAGDVCRGIVISPDGYPALRNACFI